jgi:HSP20 family protein
MTTLMRWEPMRDLWGVQRDLDRLMSGFGLLGTPARGVSGPATSEPLIPSIDMLHRDDDLVVRAEMPGITAQDIDITVSNGVLVLTGERRYSSEEKEDDYLVRETSYGKFTRSIPLPEGVEPASIHASYADGILEIVVPGAAKQIEPTAIHVPVTVSETHTSTETHH